MGSPLIKKFLSENLGLSDNEIIVYLSLLQKGPSTVLEISNDTNMNRATVHMNVGYLDKKRLITQVHKGQGSRRAIIPEPPEKLAILLREKREELLRAEKQLPDLLKDFSQLILSKKKTNLEIRYYEGEKEVKFIYEKAMQAKEFRAYINCQETMYTFIGANIQKFLDIHKRRKDMYVWEIMEDSEASRKYASIMPDERYDCRFIPKNMKLSVLDYMIFDNKVALVDPGDKVSGIMIYSKNFYQNAKEIYKFVWQFLKKS